MKSGLRSAVIEVRLGGDMVSTSSSPVMRVHSTVKRVLLACGTGSAGLAAWSGLRRSWACVAERGDDTRSEGVCRRWLVWLLARGCGKAPNHDWFGAFP